MKKIYSSTKPDSFGFCVVDGKSRRFLNYSIRNTTITEMQGVWDAFVERERVVNPEINLSEKPEMWFIEQHEWQYNQLLLPTGLWSYEVVVEAIIRDKYSQSEMEAITNNMTAVLSGFLQDLATNGILSATKWLVSNIDQDNTTRFSEMQAWRKFAKDTAKSYFK